MSVSAVIVAAGSGTRFGGPIPKQFVPLRGVPVFLHAAKRFIECAAVDAVIVVLPENEIGRYGRLLSSQGVVTVTGGSERDHSVRAGLDALGSGTDFVLIHDGVRPFAGASLIERTLTAAKEHGAAVPGIRPRDTVKLCSGEQIGSTIARDELILVQTPQAFRKDIILRAYDKARADGIKATDDAGLVERLPHPVVRVEGEYRNIKITTAEDLPVADLYLQQESGATDGRGAVVGHGFDAHRLVPDRNLVIGGVEIEYELGLLGHSDADVLCHAISDALLGAAALGDIGQHFPDHDPKYAGASSLALLSHVMGLTEDCGLRPVHVDATVVAERPKLAPYIGSMRRKLAAALGLAEQHVSVKATTTEGLGFTGRGEGIAAHAVVTLAKGVRKGSCDDE